MAQSKKRTTSSKITRSGISKGSRGGAARGDYERGFVPPVRRNCGTMAVHHRLLESSPNYRARQVELERATSARLRESGNARTTILTIPVVVHVVHNTAAQNISAA